jgi:hypothetical protein
MHYLMSFAADSISLAKAGPADVESIVQITRAAYEKYVARLGRQPRPMTADYAALVLEQPVWLLLTLICLKIAEKTINLFYLHLQKVCLKSVKDRAWIRILK